MKTTSASYLFWLIVLTVNLISAVVWNYIPSMRPEGVTNGDAAIILTIITVGTAIFVTAEARRVND